MKMKINLERVNDKVHFRAVGANGKAVDIDGSPAIGGEDAGVRPMELLLMGVAGCSGIDIVSILNKQRQPLDKFEVTVEGERPDNVEPSLFEVINITFFLYGNIDEDKAIRAVSLSMNKYCSVSKTLEKTAQINYSVLLNGEKIAQDEIKQI
ncbi:MAG: OsmC family protein [Flavobacteriales bacterium]